MQKILIFLKFFLIGIISIISLGGLLISAMLIGMSDTPGTGGTILTELSGGILKSYLPIIAVYIIYKKIITRFKPTTYLYRELVLIFLLTFCIYKFTEKSVSITMDSLRYLPKALIISLLACLPSLFILHASSNSLQGKNKSLLLIILPFCVGLSLLFYFAFYSFFFY